MFLPLFSVDQTVLSVSNALFHVMSAGASRAVDHTDTSTLMSIVVVRIFLIVLVIFLIVLVIFLIIFLVSKEISKRFVAEREAGGCDRRSLPTDHFDDPVAMVTSSGGDLRIFPMTVNSTLEMTGSAFIETKR